jgi:hypothetical protein
VGNWRISLLRYSRVYILQTAFQQHKSIPKTSAQVILERTKEVLLISGDIKIVKSAKFYAYHSVHRESVSKNSNEMALYSTLLFLVSRSTCFGHIPCPSSGAQLTVLTASGVDKQCVSSCRRG